MVHRLSYATLFFIKSHLKMLAIKTGIKKQIKKYRVVLSDRVDGLVYSRSCGQMSVRLEFQRLMSNSLSVGKRTDSRSGGRGGSAGTRGRNTQQWYA